MGQGQRANREYWVVPDQPKWSWKLTMILKKLLVDNTDSPSMNQRPYSHLCSFTLEFS